MAVLGNLKALQSALTLSIVVHKNLMRFQYILYRDIPPHNIILLEV